MVYSPPRSLTSTSTFIGTTILTITAITTITANSTIIIVKAINPLITTIISGLIASGGAFGTVFVTRKAFLKGNAKRYKKAKGPGAASRVAERCLSCSI